MSGREVRAEVLAAYAAKYLVKGAALRITKADFLEVAEAFKAAAEGVNPSARLMILMKRLGASGELIARLMKELAPYLEEQP